MALPALAGVWLWDNFGDDIKSVVKDAARKLWTRFNWSEAAQRYHENLGKQYATIQIFGQPEPVPLEGIFTHLNLLDKPTALARYDIEVLQDAVREDPSQLPDIEWRLARSEAKQVDGLELVTQPDSDRLFILGKPGAGKTTFLKYLTLQAVKGRIDRIPIFVSLKAWADSDLNLLPFLASRFDICDFPDAQPFIELVLSQGRALVLFDGLDEVGREACERMRLIPALADFCTKYCKSQCLITSRTAATDYTFESFKYVEVADFNSGQMYAFVRKWFKDNTDTCDKFWEEFWKDKHRGMRELGRIPLLLTLLCLAFRATESFPRRRADLYEDAIEALLRQWDDARGIERDTAYHKLSLGHKRQMLACVAAETFETGDYFLRQADLEKRIVDYLQHLPPADQGEDIDGTAVIKAVEAQHGILVERAHRIYSFAHLTFQEYFTASHIVDSVEEGAIPRLISHCTDDRWREVILLTASLLDKADDFFDEFRQRINGLIASDENLLAFIRWAAEKAASIQTDYKPAAVRGFYCWLDLDCALDRTIDRAIDRALAIDSAPDVNFFDLDSARDVARELARTPDVNFFDLDSAFHRAIDRAIDRDRAHALELARIHASKAADALHRVCIPDCAYVNIDHELARDIIRARAIARALALDYTRNHASALVHDINIVRDLARDHQPDLHQALITLDTPATDAPPEAWLSFADKLHCIMITHRKIGREWNFALEQIECLSTYFQANHLLVECLNVAYVSDRAAIEDSLLLPPET